MNGRTATGRQRLDEAIEKAHAAIQDAHAALYAVELAVERAENDVLAGTRDPNVMLGMTEAPALADSYRGMRTEISELRPLLVPISRWLTSARRGVGTHA